MSLAEELFDLEENDHGEEPEQCMNILEAFVNEDKIEHDENPMETDLTHITSIRQLTKLRDSVNLKKIMKQIKNYGGKLRKSKDIIGESDPEYQFVVEANNIAVDIDTEIAVVHRFARDKYQKRFPELESLVVSPLEYVMTVKELGNDLDQVKNNEILQQFLSQATIMVVFVTASTTQGTMLTSVEKQQLDEACDMAIDLNNFKQEIFEYVKSRMAFIAPNMLTIVGASIAAKILGVAGGLTELSKMPTCKVLTLGQQKKTLSGCSQVTILPFTGFIYDSEIVQTRPLDLGRTAARLVAINIILAARADACHETSDGHFGKMLKGRIAKKLDKLQRPQPGQHVKLIPEPRRRRHKDKAYVRKMKERYSMTEFRNLVSGTASSVAFTPLQGLETVNHQAAEVKVEEANAKYFSNTSGFLK